MKMVYRAPKEKPLIGHTIDLKSLKVLPVKCLTTLYLRDFLYRHKKYRIRPIIGKDGWYWSRNTTKTGIVWVEYKGFAVMLPQKYIKQFKWQLELLNSVPLRECEFDAMYMLFVAKKLPKDMLRKFQFVALRRQLTEIRLTTIRKNPDNRLDRILYTGPN